VRVFVLGLQFALYSQRDIADPDSPHVLKSSVCRNQCNRWVCGVTLHKTTIASSMQLSQRIVSVKKILGQRCYLRSFFLGIIDTATTGADRAHVVTDDDSCPR
jgi:hypothetical protein